MRRTGLCNDNDVLPSFCWFLNLLMDHNMSLCSLVHKPCFMLLMTNSLWSYEVDCRLVKLYVSEAEECLVCNNTSLFTTTRNSQQRVACDCCHLHMCCMWLLSFAHVLHVTAVICTCVACDCCHLHMCCMWLLSFAHVLHVTAVICTCAARDCCHLHMCCMWLLSFAHVLHVHTKTRTDVQVGGWSQCVWSQWHQEVGLRRQCWESAPVRSGSL